MYLLLIGVRYLRDRVLIKDSKWVSKIRGIRFYEVGRLRIKINIIFLNIWENNVEMKK